MALVVQFSGTSVISPPASAGDLVLWTYAITPDSAASLTGDRVALGLPRGIDVRDPSQFPGVPALVGAFLEADSGGTRWYAGRALTTPGSQSISFVAPSTQTDVELIFATGTVGGPWLLHPFAISAPGEEANSQLLPGPAGVSGAAGPVLSGRPVADFVGTLPYASEVFGVYQPLAGWFGKRGNNRVGVGAAALAASAGAPHATPVASPAGLVNRFRDLASIARADPRGRSAPPAGLPAGGVLSPVGLVNLFREYFFQFDTFLGVPVGHIWVSPGGTVEVVETSTRRTLVESMTTQSETTDRKTEESLTSQDDVADAVKEDNANDTKLGASASGGAQFAGVAHVEASASFSTDSTIKKSSEDTHKHTRTQSAKVSSEIKRNFETTFKTVTESTDTTSRRYLLQNTTAELVNYELRRKVRKVGVQVQHIGTRLSWQVYLDVPGRDLGLGEMVHVVPAPDLSALKRPEKPPPLNSQDSTITGSFPISIFPGTSNSPDLGADYRIVAPGSDELNSFDNAFHLVSFADFSAPPPAAGYFLSAINLLTAKVSNGNAKFQADYEVLDSNQARFRARANFLNPGNDAQISLTFSLTWQPPALDPAQVEYQLELDAYNAQVAELQREAYANAIRDRLLLVSKMQPRPSADLRREERETVYGNLITQLELFPSNPHLGSELVRQIFDVDEMLYFVAPDYWRPHVKDVHPTQTSVGKYPAPAPVTSGGQGLEDEIVTSWYSHTDPDNQLDPSLNASPEWRVNYLMTEVTQPAPLGSSLGWLIQIDGDERRNEFLNAAWVKAVLPVRPGHELEALAWLAQAGVEGEDGLGAPYPYQQGDPPGYQNKTVGEVLQLLATDLQSSNSDFSNTLATEKVFETGFDPLSGGFRPAAAYQIFTQWVEVMPTDQIVAVQVQYDPRTGLEL